jgi:hypothetical protein
LELFCPEPNGARCKKCAPLGFDILEDDNTKAMYKVCQEKGSRIVIRRGGKHANNSPRSVCSVKLGIFPLKNAAD